MLSSSNKHGVSDTEMSIQDYQAIRDFLSEACGIVLGDNKQYLVKNRLAGILVKFDLANFAELVYVLQGHTFNTGKIKAAVIDAMTTNETFWFRDDAQFAILKDYLLADVFNRKSGTVKVWSAACSSGQEPYTVSMCVNEVEKKRGKQHPVQIIGTDISESVLLEAKAAVYSELALARGIDDQTKQQFFRLTPLGYQLNSDIVQRVRFQQFNLLKPFSVLGHFDIIFCRNVLIYFSEAVKKDILTRMVDVLEPDGVLFLSSTESMPFGVDGVESVIKGRVRYFKKIG